MNRRPSAPQRLSEICDFLAPSNNVRKSRLEAPKVSFIPRPSGRSLERVSGAQPSEGPSSAAARHRSADSGRVAYSAQRASTHSRSRSTFMKVRETPSQRTPLARQLMQTPMSAMANRPRTPSTERQRGRLTCMERAILAMPGKDIRKISEQSWQRRTCERVVSHLRSHPIAAPLLPPSGAPLRPITIKLFVELANCLLGLPNHVNTGNYVQKLPVTARKLLYPGVMTKSWLKSVNAMHTFPNMLGFLSYLVDYSRVKELIAERMTLSKISGEEKRGPIALLRQQFYLDCWEAFQNPMDPDFSLNLEVYIRALKEVHQVSDDEIMKVKEKITELALLTASPSTLEARAAEAELRAQPAALEQRARGLRARCDELERKLAQRQHALAATRAAVQHADGDRRRLECEIEMTKKTLSEQKMTVRQRDDMCSEVERIMAAVDSKREFNKDIEKMGYTKDLELSSLQKKALVASIAMNHSLVATGLAAGVNLNQYTIDERDLLSGNAVEENKLKIDQVLTSIKIKCEDRLQKARQNKEAGVCRKQQIKIQLESERQRVETLRGTLAGLRERGAARRGAGAERAARAREAAQGAGQRAAERRRRAADRLRAAQRSRDHWLSQDDKWRTKLEQLRSEEDTVRRTCEARATALVGQYLSLAKTAMAKSKA